VRVASRGQIWPQGMSLDLGLYVGCLDELDFGFMSEIVPLRTRPELSDNLWSLPFVDFSRQ
jgi:hypothetical protein